MTLQKKKDYKNIFFDLDRTLWDFQSNSELTLNVLITPYLNGSVSFEDFLSAYYHINENLWLRYRKGEITKSFLRAHRFTSTFELLNINIGKEYISKISNDYIEQSPLQTQVFNGTFELLDYLKTKNYHLYLITNGFIEVQVKKIQHSKLEPYFKKMITSDEAGYQKPDRRIFEYALKYTNSKKTESIMIGDDQETDIAGAINFGMDAVWFNPNREKQTSKPTYIIENLLDLKQVL